MLFLNPDQLESSKKTIDHINTCEQLMTSKPTFRVYDELRDIKKQICNKKVANKM